MFQMPLQKIRHGQKPNLPQLPTATMISAVKRRLFIARDLCLGNKTLRITVKTMFFMKKHKKIKLFFCVFYLFLDYILLE